jgi:hypothetical protein
LIGHLSTLPLQGAKVLRIPLVRWRNALRVSALRCCQRFEYIARRRQA